MLRLACSQWPLPFIIRHLESERRESSLFVFSVAVAFGFLSVYLKENDISDLILQVVDVSCTTVGRELARACSRYDLSSYPLLLLQTQGNPFIQVMLAT